MAEGQIMFPTTPNSHGLVLGKKLPAVLFQFSKSLRIFFAARRRDLFQSRRFLLTLAKSYRSSVTTEAAMATFYFQLLDHDGVRPTEMAYNFDTCRSSDRRGENGPFRNGGRWSP
jgi:hypothetical protein